jgi:outer membrane protein, multidrug efflux system
MQTNPQKAPMMQIPIRSYGLAIAVAIALAGCATPIAKSSTDNLPGRFVATPASDMEPEAAWWDGFGDPVLSDLVRRAARENRDVRIAAERVRAARSGETISRSFLMPSVGVSASGLNQKSRYDAETRQLVPDAKVAAAGVDVSWEVDLSGRLRAGAAAAAADAMATEDGARGVRLLAITDVATNYFTLKGALRQLDTMRAIAASQDETLRLVQARERAGLATSFDVERAKTDTSRAHAAIPPLETIAAVSRHRIAVLVGGQAFNAAAIVPFKGEATVPATRAGQPADLLQRRPDLLAAKAQLDAANARRQQAAAEWFPRLFLGAVFGRQGVDLNGSALGAARFTNAAALLAMPIFNAGRTQAVNDVAESAQTQSVIAYEDVIAKALEDVENSLVALHHEQQRAQSLRDAVESADSALTRARSLYARGQVDLLPLLDAQRAQLATQLGANDGNTQVLLDSVGLYKALGGGWQVFEAAGPAAASGARPPNS